MSNFFFKRNNLARLMPKQAGRFFMMAVSLFERPQRVLTGNLFSLLRRLIRPVHGFRKRLAQPIRKIRSFENPRR
jgi:hypothetical protein